VSFQPTPEDPLLCPRDQKATLEVQNQATLIAYVTEFFRDVAGRSPYTLPTILTLHKLTIENIYPCAGMLRPAGSTVEIHGSGHRPPDPYLVENELRDLLEIARTWRDHCRSRKDRLYFAARCFHRFNQIHPFMGGNGRVGRAFLLLMLMDMQNEVPPDLLLDYIRTRRDEYIDALGAADRGDLRPIEDFVAWGVLDSSNRYLANLLLREPLGDVIRPRLKADERRLLERRAWTLSLSVDQYMRASDRLQVRLVKIVEKLVERQRATSESRP
jgi:Fic family protein